MSGDIMELIQRKFNDLVEKVEAQESMIKDMVGEIEDLKKRLDLLEWDNS